MEFNIAFISGVGLLISGLFCNEKKMYSMEYIDWLIKMRREIDEAKFQKEIDELKSKNHER